MNREQAKAFILSQEPDFLLTAPKKINGRPSYICPVCGNGSGPTGTGIALDPHDLQHRHYKCFACGMNEDIIGLWKALYNVQDDSEAFRGLYDHYNVTVDGTAEADFATPIGMKEKAAPVTSEDLRPSADAAQDFLKWHLDVGKTTYFSDRGLTAKTIDRFRLGYAENFRARGYLKWNAAIIPTGGDSYVVRNTDPGADKGNRYDKHGPVQLLNLPALWTAAAPVFIVEGEIDALSIIEVGGEAVALGSAANGGMLIRAVKQKAPVQPLIIALDNDKTGAEDAEKLEADLRAAGFYSYRRNPAGDHKDANEALVADRVNFAIAVHEIENEVAALIQEERAKELEAYTSTSAGAHVQDFLNGVAASVDTPLIETGFAALDTVLEGGLYEGLYTIGAISSLGKTTFMLQIMDQIAQAGHDVLIFSLEMSRSELMAKSISRITLDECIEYGYGANIAKTARGITAGYRYKNYSHDELKVIEHAVRRYEKYAGHIFIQEGVGDYGVVQIREAVRRHISLMGTSPVVLVDYLQILAPADVRASDKQNTDHAVVELKRISRDYKIPVIAVSSFNRQNYTTPAAMEAFKESGAVEYTSDVLLGMQFKGVGDKAFDVNEAKKKNPREVEIVILKNRNGATGRKLSYSYYPMFNYYEED